MTAKHWTSVDETLNDSFPASDPPAWNQGRQKTEDERESRQAEGGAGPAPPKPRVKRKRIQIGPTDIS